MTEKRKDPTKGVPEAKGGKKPLKDLPKIGQTKEVRLGEQTDPGNEGRKPSD